MAGKDFLNDFSKLYDFFKVGKSDFLKKYSYLNEDDYDATVVVFRKMSLYEKLDLIERVETAYGESGELGKAKKFVCDKADKEMLRLRYHVFELECKFGKSDRG